MDENYEEDPCDWNDLEEEVVARKDKANRTRCPPRIQGLLKIKKGLKNKRDHSTSDPSANRYRYKRIKEIVSIIS